MAMSGNARALKPSLNESAARRYRKKSAVAAFMGAAVLTAGLSGCSGVDTIDPAGHIKDDRSDPAEALRTSWSMRLADIERRANEISDMPVIILDDDDILLQAEAGPYRLRLQYWLARQGIQLSRRDLSGLYRAMGGPFGDDQRAPQALKTTAVYKGQEQDICLVVPENPDYSNAGLLQSWLGKAGAFEMNVQKSVIEQEAGGAYALAERTVWHETWHCLDNIYEPAYRTLDPEADIAGFSQAIHRAELFADIAAGLTMAAQGHSRQGALIADARAIRSAYVGPRLMDMYNPAHDYQYYGGVTYYTAPGLDAVEGAAARLTPAQHGDLRHLGQLAARLTREYALDERSYNALTRHLRAARPADSSHPAVRQYDARVAAAYDRLVRPTMRKVMRDPDHVPDRLAKRLAVIPEAEKNDVRRRLMSRRQEAVSSRAALVAELESWRQAIHNTALPQPAAERRLYVGRLMLQAGMLDSFLNDSAPRCTERSGHCRMKI